ncbi:MAG: hypothetical protein KDA66_09525, partial [Planctomycetaceae bacterium]|nr:hypothetical protein [Planctomycetaceae bacterium]
MFRNCQTTIILLALLSLLGQEASAQDDVAERALKLEREVLAYRESLVNIQAEISEKRGGRVIQSWKVWQKGNRIRLETR